MGADLNFEACLTNLDRAVSALEGGDLGLDQALSRYEEGVRLLARCHALLDDADRKVALLIGVDDDGTPRVAPFDGSATAPGVRESSPSARKLPVPAEGEAEDLDDLPF